MNENDSTAGTISVRLKIFGVGGGGVAMLEQMRGEDFAGAEFIAIDSDASSMAALPAQEKIHLETKMLRGMGTGGDPERGRELAEAHVAQIKAACAGGGVVFIMAGLGGGAGTGIAPVVARTARESGALVLAFVTLPFECEGNRRHNQARAGLEQLKAAADGVICLPCQKATKLIDENMSLLDTFKTTTQLLLDGVRGVWRLLAFKGLIPLHFADLSALLRDRHAENHFAAAEASGVTRASVAVEKCLAHPMLDGGAALAESEAVLVSIVGGPDMTLADVKRVMEPIKEKCSRGQIIMGAVVNEKFRDQIALTVIAARKSQRSEKPPVEGEEPAAESPGFDSVLLRQATTKKPASRYSPPVPALTSEQREEILTKQEGKPRTRKVSARSRQMPLPLEIVSKSRFDKTEATIHNGEDLDVPTYIRRGISMN